MKGKTLYAYTAGIIDGEGCITLNYQAPDPKIQSRHSRYWLKVDVGNTNEWLCQWLKMQYGGTVVYVLPKKLAHSPAWRWFIHARQARSFLELILPYLQLKRQQAEIGIAYQKSRRKPGTRALPMERVLDEAQAILMHKLNRKGPKDEPR